METDNEQDFRDLYAVQPFARISYNLYDINVWQHKGVWMNSKFVV